MDRTQRSFPGTIRRMLALTCLVPLLLVGTTACATPTDDVAGQSGSSGDDGGSADEGTAADALESLDSAELLELGMTGDAAITCDFKRGNAVGTIYFNGPDRQRFDSVTADGVPAHIVLHEGQAHAWNDEQSEGVRYPKPGGYSGLVGEDPEDVKEHSTNCVPHDDLSVFELPTDVMFVDLPVE